MADKKLATQDDARLIKLEQCELKIRNAAHMNLDARVIIGHELNKIREEELFLARADDFVDYVEHYWDMSRKTADRMIAVAQAVTVLKLKKLPVPENEMQILELVKLDDPEQQTHIWQRTIDLCERAEKPVTAARIRRVIKAEQPPPPPEDGKGVEVNLDGFGPTEQASAITTPAPTPKTISLSEKGEIALDRIGRLCGSQTQEAIENGNIQISQRDIILWADQDDQTVRNLAYYVANERWTVRQGINYEQRVVTGATTLDDLGRLCLARGTGISFIHPMGPAKIQITVEPMMA